MMNKNCEMVRDLLPLYIDNVCSSESRAYVEGHLSACQECSEIEKSMRNTNMDAMLKTETENVLKRYAKKERTAAWKAGSVISCILAVPILLVAVVLSANQTNFIVLPIIISSMLLVASLSVVPLMSKKDKFARTILSATASMILIVFFASLDEGFSFASVAVPTVLGLSIPFLPFVLKAEGIPETFKKKKAATCIIWDLVFLFLTITVDSFPEQENASFREGTIFMFVLLILALISFGVSKIIRSDLNKLAKAGIVILSAGLIIAFLRDVAKMYLNGAFLYAKGFFDISNWTPTSIISSLILAVLGFVILMCSIIIIAAVSKKILEE